MQFMQPDSLIKFTLMFNVLPGTEISVYAEFAIVGSTGTMDYRPCVAAWHERVGGGSVHIWIPLARKWGVGTAGPPTGSPPLHITRQTPHSQTGSVYGTESCKVLFLFTCSDTFAAGCIV